MRGERRDGCRNRRRLWCWSAGPFVSFANCGLPYHVGGVIAEEKSLLVVTPELIRSRFRIDVRPGHEVVSIDRDGRTVRVRAAETGEESEVAYDVLVLSTGASPIRPPLPGIETPGIFTLRSIPDTRAIREWIAQKGVKRAVVVGGGFIGLEMAENLVHLGIEVTIVEGLSQVMAPIDAEMAELVHERLRARGVELMLDAMVAGFERQADGSIEVMTKDGRKTRGEMVILSIGVRPDVELAKGAGLELGKRGGIKVDEQMRTSDPQYGRLAMRLRCATW